MYSMQGRKVYERMHEFAPPVYSMDIHTADWASGGYLVQCRGGGWVTTMKVGVNLRLLGGWRQVQGQR
jgi:hypothetical protein